MLLLTVGSEVICEFEMLVAAPVFSAENFEAGAAITIASLSISESSSRVAFRENVSASWSVTSVYVRD